MHPALSVIFFTTISGAGYGLAFLLSLGFSDPSASYTKWAWFASLSLISLGLLSSLLHLGNPQRAWRAFSQWRSSWLSREGCMAILTFIPLCTLASLSIFDDRTIIFIGFVSAFFCAITVYCTAMIYASLRPIPQWHTSLTPLCYFGFSLSSGSLLLSSFSPSLSFGFLNFTLAILCFAWSLKYLWRRRATLVGYGESTISSATGLGSFGDVRLLDRPHTLGNYLTNEMVFRLARKHEIILWRLSLLFGYAFPVILLFLFFPLFAFLFHLLGLFLERYLFFATARHAVSLYYGVDD